MENTIFFQHPWELLKEELEIREISQKDFANIIWKSVSELSELINKKRKITPSWAILIWEALWISAEFWLWMQRSYDLSYYRWIIGKDRLLLVKEKAKSFNLVTFMNA